ncbi:uncharacterized protein MONOS_15278 [Monocercomonoides exilis]|uniref:uncharacterized protein n=1 Tax=Monocercomonoides exilis TaxID=2049356 RepID=UPI00355A8FE7|nr:hypothetical protein MONOS_15278 [Monocercomonoides exilis]|eukprot:MONOS_15278.1-p1 / transcript=MONOS_15278.1 / gene=MONOS_15278 / organism=Monocercomonoides_exilis_PA203 / gene_product=unspecified product / transcript_product=unspecified product / location=Mono_scaffold01188:3693-4925(-) / protein_length=386 / sequence_SO=supercontig / SO=protein_coding / is_pseudo=false
MDDTDPLRTKDAKWIMVEITEKLSSTNLSSGVIHQTVRKVLDSINLFREIKIDVKDIEIFFKTYVGEKPRKGKRYKTMWDSTIITKCAETTYDSKDIRTLQKRALILTMIFGAFRPAELERMRSDTIIFIDKLVQTQEQTKTSAGETVKTTFKDEHVWFNISERQPANLQRIKEELVAVLRENGIPDTFTAYSIRHAVITHLAKQQDADWKAINAYARWAPGSRVAQEYYTVLPVQDTRWILETIGGPVPLAEKGDKSEKDSDRKDSRNEKTIPGIKEYTGESLQDGGEVEVSKRKRSKRRGPIRERRSQRENDITQPPKGEETPPIIPRCIMELTKGRQTASRKKLEANRRKRGERSIGQIVCTSRVSKTRSRTPREHSKRGRE